MRKTLLSFMSAATLMAAAVATPTKAEANCYGCWVGAGVAAGLIGGAVIANNYGYRGYGGYGYGGYGYGGYGYGGYGYGYGYAPTYYAPPSYAYGPGYYGYVPRYGYGYGYGYGYRAHRVYHRQVRRAAYRRHW